MSEESLLSDEEEDFTNTPSSMLSAASATPAAPPAAPPAKKRRSYNISANFLSEAVRRGGIMDGDEPCATLADIAQYITTKRGYPNDRALKNSLYQKLKSAPDIEKREEHVEGMKRRKSW